MGARRKEASGLLRHLPGGETGKPPCESCEWGRPPAILPENEEAWSCGGRSRPNGGRAGFGILGLDYGVVCEHGPSPEHRSHPALIAKIQALERAALEDFR